MELAYSIGTQWYPHEKSAVVQVVSPENSLKKKPYYFGNVKVIHTINNNFFLEKTHAKLLLEEILLIWQNYYSH